MLVYVLNQDSKPLMPCGPAKARRLLREQQARVVKRTPFTIQLLYGSSGYKQPITLGVDAGSKFVGLSAVTEKKEVFSGELQLRNDIVELLSTKRMYRNHRRFNKTRYRQTRFLNRTKPRGWLAPSIRNKIEAHKRIIYKTHKILPISKIVIEVANFDIQKIKNPEIKDKEYQSGPQKDFYNVRAYVLHRDGHRCHGKAGCGNKILQIHHIESRKTGGNAPDNLITLCKECHDLLHKGLFKLRNKRSVSVKDASFMGIMRKSLVSSLRSSYPIVEETYGYLTKSVRIKAGLEKSHRNDALCVTGNPSVYRCSSKFLTKQIRKHNRQIHKALTIKGGNRPLKVSPHLILGFRLHDKILYKRKEYFIKSRRNRGYFSIVCVNNSKLSALAHVNNIIILEKSRSIIWNR